MPLTEDGAPVLEPEITWGAGNVLIGDQVALMLPADGRAPSPDADVGTPTMTVAQDPSTINR